METVTEKPSSVGHTKDTWDQEAADLGFRVVGPMRGHGNYTLGLLLTAIEAALGDSKQAQALKAITRREMFALIDRNQAEVYEHLGVQKPGLAPKETWVDGQDYLKEQKEYDEANQ